MCSQACASSNAQHPWLRQEAVSPRGCTCVKVLLRCVVSKRPCVLLKRGGFELLGTASSSVPWIVSSPGLWAWLSCSLVAYNMLRLGALSLRSASFAIASGCPLEGPTIFGSCYIPCSGPARRVAKLALEAELTYLRARFPTTPVCVLGDFKFFQPRQWGTGSRIGYMWLWGSSQPWQGQHGLPSRQGSCVQTCSGSCVDFCGAPVNAPQVPC